MSGGKTTNNSSMYGQYASTDHTNDPKQLVDAISNKLKGMNYGSGRIAELEANQQGAKVLSETLAPVADKISEALAPVVPVASRISETDANQQQGGAARSESLAPVTGVLSAASNAWDDWLSKQDERIANTSYNSVMSNPFDINLNNAITQANAFENYSQYRPMFSSSSSSSEDSSSEDSSSDLAENGDLTQQQRWMNEGYDYAIDNAARGNDAALQSGLDSGWITYNDDYWTYEVGTDEDGNEVGEWVLKDGVDDQDLDASDYYVLNDGDWEDFYGDIYVDPDGTYEEFWVGQFNNDENGGVYDEALAQYDGDAQALYDAIVSGEYSFYTNGDDYTDAFYDLDDISRTIVETGIMSDAISSGALDSDDPYARQAISDWDNYTLVLGNYENGTATEEQVEQAWNAYYTSATELANQVIGGLYMENYENGEYSWDEDPETANSAFNTIAYVYGIDDPYSYDINDYISYDDYESYLDYNNKGNRYDANEFLIEE